ncbi:hypothetical protein OPT61_g2976 [Boeremia exigua]|uniref:Uncharacterized protein n=1 Tax=Boeremia exigua TaxID=749465 RepID=A0ACC2IJQ7_9PLEO|nr:hypothetical protein OPT61_g2976 [Boeremia exigua]
MAESWIKSQRQKSKQRTKNKELLYSTPETGHDGLKLRMEFWYLNGLEIKQDVTGKHESKTILETMHGSGLDLDLKRTEPGTDRENGFK